MIRVYFLVVLAALCAAPAARAETDVGFSFYENQAKTVLKAAGAKVWECADEAKRQGFHAFADEQAERALEFDPNQAEAREHLKYVRKEGAWVRVEEDWKNAPHQNTHNQAESKEGYEKRVKKWQDETLPKTDKYVAAKYAELGDICAAKGYPEQAVKGYEASMRLDKNNEKARKGLGYTKFGKVWLTKKQDEARKAASKPVEIKQAEKTGYEELLNTKLNKLESAHFRIECAFPIEEATEHIKAAETCYAYYLADFGRDPGEDSFDGGRMTFVILNTEDQWNKWVDTYASDKEFTRQLGGCGGGPLCHGIRGSKPTVQKKNAAGGTDVEMGSTAESRRDMLVHMTTHELNERVWKLDGKKWLDEGLAYYFSLKVLETCSTHCVAQKKGDYANGNIDEGGLKKWDDPNNWKPLLKQLVQKKNDVPLRSITMLPLTKLQYLDTIKAWSVASWLMDLDRDKFTSCLDQMLDKAVKQENVIQGTYGKGYEDIDEDWKKYVRKAY